MTKFLTALAAAALVLAGSVAPTLAGNFNPLKVARDAAEFGLDTAKKAVDLGLDTADKAADVAKDAVTPNKPRSRPKTVAEETAARDCHSGELYRDGHGEWQTCAATR